MDKLINTTIAGRYVLEKKLDSGGMGSIFLARDKLISKQVVLKNLHSFKKSKNNIERFRQEAEILKKLDHDNIVTIIDHQSWNDEIFIVLEYLNGHSLQEKIDKKKFLSIEEISSIYFQTLDALEAAHSKSVVHRDLKPSNIFCIPKTDAPDFIKILDFGISIILDEDQNSRLTKTGEIIGTPIYLSPEQITGKQNISYQTDIYSMGVILFEMFAGFPPFSGLNDMDVLLGHLYRTPGEIQRPDLEEHPLFAKFQKVIKRSLMKNIDDRFRSINEIREFFKSENVPEIKRGRNFINDRRTRHKESLKKTISRPESSDITQKREIGRIGSRTTSRTESPFLKEVKVAAFEDEKRSIEMSLIPLLMISNYSLIDEIDFNNIHNSPDIIILNEGNENNLENLKKLRSESASSAIPILVCGKEDDLDLISKSINAGATDYIPFPFSPEEIVRKIIKYSKSSSNRTKT